MSRARWEGSAHQAQRVRERIFPLGGLGVPRMQALEESGEHLSNSGRWRGWGRG